MKKRCEVYWDRFVASQVNAQSARSERERIVWLQVAEMWLTLAQAEQILSSTSPARASVSPLTGMMLH
jgi:hypothetical protein